MSVVSLLPQDGELQISINSLGYVLVVLIFIIPKIIIL